MHTNDKDRRRVRGTVKSYILAGGFGFVKLMDSGMSGAPDIRITDEQFCNVVPGSRLDAARFSQGRRLRVPAAGDEIYLLVDTRNLAYPKTVVWAFADGRNEAPAPRHVLRSVRPIRGESTPCIPRAT
jgi:hypothetical protein